MITARELHRSYDAPRSLGGLGPRRGDPIRAVAGVSFDVAAGEIVGLAGANGSGKTTVLRLLAGLVTPDAGASRVAGVDPARDRVGVAARAALLTGEERSFYLRISGRQNLELFGALSGLRTAEAAARAGAALDRVELAYAADRRVAGYSSGMRQRLAMARTLMRGARVLLLDELTRALDDAGHARLWAIAREEAEAGAAVLATATRMIDLDGRCDRRLAIANGALA